MSADPVALESLGTPGRTRATARDNFYLGMTFALAGIVVAGFMPTFFGRAFFNVMPIPGYLLLHGLVLVGWYTLLATQAALAGTGRLALHRRLGWAALAFMVLVPVAGMGVQLALPARLAELGMLDALRPMVENIFWLNFAAVLQFVGFIGAALWFRARSEVHKRLMLFAGIAIIQPAAARLSRWPVFGNQATDLSQPASTGYEVLFAVGCVLLLVAVIAAHDLVKRRRVHPTTWAGLAVIIGMGALARVCIESEWGKAFVWAVS